jgi:hypothetical protein
MKTKILALMLLASSAVLAQRVSIGIGVNVGPAYGGYYAATPPPPPPPVMYAPPMPAPGYVWVPGYYAYSANRYVWNAGYWSRPPHPRAKWVVPRYKKGRYQNGYWR